MQINHQPTLKRILTVEDDQALRLNLAGYLEDCGYEVIEAGDGKAGLAAYQEHHPDLVLVDLHMPEMDGVSLLQQLSALSDETPLIVVSGASDINEAIAATQSGAWDFVLKPLKDMKSLESVIARSWDRACLVMENRRYQDHLEDEVNSRTLELSAANQELQANRELLANAERIAKLGSWSWQPQSGQLRWSEELFEILGLPNTAVPEMQAVLDRIPEEERILFQAALDELGQKGGQIKIEHRIQAPDGGLRVLLHQAKAAGDPLGSRLDGVALDITDRRLMEDELRGAKEAAEAASQAKSNFMATMSHELRTPLNGVIGMAQLIQSESTEEEVRHWAQVILTSGNALLRIIDEILDLTKIERGQLDLLDEPFELHSYLENLTELFGATAKAKRLEFALEIGHDIPQWVVGDADRLTQVLTNLLGNAFKFTQEGSISLSCLLEKSEEEQVWLRFKVRDTGVGVPLELREVIFEPFVQAEMTSTRRFGGLGLGLSIVRHLVSRLQGSLTMTSEPGKGSCFEVLLPLKLIGEILPLTQADAKAPGGLPIHQMPLRVLVAEDDQINQDVISALLNHMHCQVQTVNNGQEAVEAFEQANYDLVLLDLLMPLMDGYETVRRMRAVESQQSRRPLPIYAVSAKTGSEEESRCIEAGMNGYICKPIGLTRLSEVIREAQSYRKQEV
ncbi:MAG: response regulator [bacterium]|nr:response regulator [bacterium]